MTATLMPGPGRVPPHDLDAEAAVLSTVLLNGAGEFERLDGLEPSDFYSDANRRIYAAALDLAKEGTPVDVVTVARRLRDADRLTQVGGTPYIAQLANATPATAHVEAHAAIIREKARLCRFIAACHRGAAEGYGAVGNVSEFLHRHEAAILAASGDAATQTPVDSFAEVLPVVLRQLEERRTSGSHLVGIASGFTAFDQQIGGWGKSLYIIAGRPGMGKTAFVLQNSVHVAQAGAASFFLSGEMPREQLVLRVLAAMSRVNHERLRNPKELTDAEWRRLAAAAADLSKLPWSVIDKRGLSVVEVRALVRRKLRELQQPGAFGPDLKLGLVALDYLQIMRGTRGDRDNREQEVGSISRDALQLVGDLDCAVIGISQLNRAVETRGKDKRPQLSDLRESGSLEQDGDTICFVYRDEYYFKDSPDQGIAEVIVAKQRNGRLGTLKLKWNGAWQRFDDLAIEQYGDGTGDGFQPGF